MQEQEHIDIHGRIDERQITDEVRQSYLDYAMSVIVSRALPDVRDGMKPVHRRIPLYRGETRRDRGGDARRHR